MDSKKVNKRASVDPLNYISKKSKIISPNLFFPNSTQFHESCLSQIFLLPIPIMKYIWENPSTPEVIQNPNLSNEHSNEWRYCTAEKCNLICCFEKSKEIVLEKFKDNIWLTGKFIVRHDPSNLISYLTPKIYRSSITKLEIYNQTIYYNDLQCLASGSEEGVLCCSSVKYENGEEVLLEKVIQLFSNCKTVSIIFCDNYYNAECKSYVDFVNACSSIKKIWFQTVSLSFDIYELYQHLKNSKNRAMIRIYSSSSASQHRLKEVVDEILQTETFDFVPLAFDYFHSEDEEKYQKLLKIQENVAAKYC